MYIYVYVSIYVYVCVYVYLFSYSEYLKIVGSHTFYLLDNESFSKSLPTFGLFNAKSFR